MTLALDTRQRAMLQEMGITVWQPKDTDFAVTAVTAVTAVSAEAVVVVDKQQNTTNNIATQAINTLATAKILPKIAIKHELSDKPALVLKAMAAGLQEMDWPSLQQTAQSCQACQLCTGRKNCVFGVQSTLQKTDWLIVGDPPTESDEAASTPFTGEAGVLLANMLKAMGLGAEQVTLLPAVKCRTEGQSTGAQELAQCEAFLRRQVALTRPKMILAMGRYAAQALLANSVSNPVPPLGQLRGVVHHYQGVPVVVTYSPANLLRNSADKAKAWTDLCLAKSVL